MIGADRDHKSAQRHYDAMKRLVRAVQDLSLARDIEHIQAVVRRVARDISGADGATFILKDNDQCHYVDEDAIGPLWRGRRFPQSSCISGWVMQHRSAAAIEDVFIDARIPHDVYRKTFVKSLVIVPIRSEDPIGAIGVYWATPHRASIEEVELLQTLADTTAVAMDNVNTYRDLEDRVQQRTQELEQLIKELNAFSYSVSHDLRGPLRAIHGFTQSVIEEGNVTGRSKDDLKRVLAAAVRMEQLIDDLLKLSRAARQTLDRREVDLTECAIALTDDLRREHAHSVELRIAPDMKASADAGLMIIVLQNLLSNAWKFTSKTPGARIEMGVREEGGEPVYFVRDNGDGFDMHYADQLFTAFQRLHHTADFPGTGIGLAIVQRIIARHGGRVWAEAAPKQGATFFFTLPPA